MRTQIWGANPVIGCIQWSYVSYSEFCFTLLLLVYFLFFHSFFHSSYVLDVLCCDWLVWLSSSCSSSSSPDSSSESFFLLFFSLFSTWKEKRPSQEKIYTCNSTVRLINWHWLSENIRFAMWIFNLRCCRTIRITLPLWNSTKNAALSSHMSSHEIWNFDLKMLRSI